MAARNFGLQRRDEHGLAACAGHCESATVKCPTPVLCGSWAKPAPVRRMKPPKPPLSFNAIRSVEAEHPVVMTFVYALGIVAGFAAGAIFS